MPKTYPRSQLDVDRLYYCIPTEQWFSTPDKRGCYFYESRAEGLHETGTEEQHIGFISQPLSDW